MVQILYGIYSGEHSLISSRIKLERKSKMEQEERKTQGFVEKCRAVLVKGSVESIPSRRHFPDFYTKTGLKT